MGKTGKEEKVGREKEEGGEGKGKRSVQVNKNLRLHSCSGLGFVITIFFRPRSQHLASASASDLASLFPGLVNVPGIFFYRIVVKPPKLETFSYSVFLTSILCLLCLLTILLLYRCYTQTMQTTWRFMPVLRVQIHLLFSNKILTT